MALEVEAGISYTIYLYLELNLPSPRLELELDLAARTCTPGSGGVLVGTASRSATTLPPFQTNLILADDSSGWVYAGGWDSSDVGHLYRLLESGAQEDVKTAAGLVTADIGHSLVRFGNSLYLADGRGDEMPGASTITRLSEGAGWSRQTHATFPATLKGLGQMEERGGQFWLSTYRPSEVWTTAATTPSTPSFNRALGALGSCGGLTLDAQYLYLLCQNDAIVRIPVVGGAPEVVTSEVPVPDPYKSKMRGADLDGDGLYDVLYVNNGRNRVHYVCTPRGVGRQFHGVLLDLGSGPSSALYSYGMDLSRPSGSLFVLDRFTRELVRID